MLQRVDQPHTDCMHRQKLILLFKHYSLSLHTYWHIYIYIFIIHSCIVYTYTYIGLRRKTYWVHVMATVFIVKWFKDKVQRVQWISRSSRWCTVFHSYKKYIFSLFLSNSFQRKPHNRPVCSKLGFPYLEILDMSNLTI